jgi:hypothetical protein
LPQDLSVEDVSCGDSRPRLSSRAKLDGLSANAASLDVAVLLVMTELATTQLQSQVKVSPVTW